MNTFKTITDADLMDYLEHRLSHSERTLVDARLATDPKLAAQLARLRQRATQMRSLGPILRPDGLPLEWLRLLARYTGR